MEDLEEQFVGLAAGKYNIATNTRLIYLSAAVDFDTRTPESILVEYALRNSDLLQTSIFSMPIFIYEHSELEISSQNKAWLMANFNPPLTGTSDVVTFLHPNTPTPIEYNVLGEQITGLEWNDDATLAYVNAAEGSPRITKMSGSQPAIIPIQSTVNNSQNNNINNSQIELARDGSYYALKDNGDVWKINGSTATDTYMSIGSSAMIKNSIYSDRLNRVDYYMLPDQIDGALYNETYTDPTICCFENVTSDFVNNMNNTVGLVGADLKVTGTNVVWTPTNNPFTTGTSTPEVYFRGNINVEPGAKLTIQDMIIHFDENKGINLTYATSGNGSKLLIDDATLTVYEVCGGDSKMWKGIKVYGNDGDQGTDPWLGTQPYLKMINSFVEYAETGIRSQNGGNATIINTTFKDNLTGIVYYSSTLEHSIIRNCNFKTTDDLYILKGQEPTSHIYLYSANNIDIYGTTFINYADEVNISNGYPDHGIGILSINSNYSVKWGLIPDPPFYDVCKFSNLYYGIYDIGLQATNAFVDKAIFSNNKAGAWFRSKSPTVINSNFNLIADDGTLDLFDSFGLYLSGCTGYHIEGNSYYNGLLGLQIYNSGPYPNEIYRNTFSNPSYNGLALGIVAVGNNRNKYTKDGLTFICNEFSNTDYAISVLGGNLSSFSTNFVETDIAFDQGVLSGSTYKIPKNDFCSTSSTGEHDFLFNNDVLDLGSYSYYDNLSNPELISYDPNKIDREPGLTGNTCPDQTNLALSLNKDTDLSTINEIENSAEQEIIEATYDINELSLLISAQSANTSNEAYVYEELMNGAPYLSDTVLLTFMNNDQVSELSRTSVLRANSPLPLKVNEELSNASLSTELINYLNQFQNGVNALEALENNLQNIRSGKQKHIFSMQRDIMNIPDSIDVNAYMQALEADNSIFAKQSLFALHMNFGNFASAKTYLNQIREETMLENAFINRDKLFIDSLLVEIGLETLSETNINNYITKLSEIASDVNNNACTYARNVLEVYSDQAYLPMTALPNPNHEKSAIADNFNENIERPSITPELESRFNIFPNPVNDKLSVEFISMSKTCDFVVYDMNGKIVQQITRNEALGYFVLDVSNLKSGNYIIYSPQLSEKKQFVVKR